MALYLIPIISHNNSASLAKKIFLKLQLYAIYQIADIRRISAIWCNLCKNVLIRTRFFSPKLKQICLSFMSFPISFISFSYCALTYLSSVAVALPCMYYIREEVKSEDFIWILSKNSYYLIAKIIPINLRYAVKY